MKLGTIYLGTFGKGASPDWNLFRWVGSDKFRLRVWPLITVGMWGMSVVRKEQAPTNEPPETGTVCPCATDDVKNWCGRCSANFRVVKGYCRPLCQHCGGSGRIQQQEGTTP